MNAGIASAEGAQKLPWRLWTNQITAIARMDLRKNLFTRRGFWIYLLAFAPVVIIALHAILDHGRPHRLRLQEDTIVLAAIFQFYYLRLAIYFGCMGIFTRLVRGEMVERSLHFYLLAPVRREVMVLGKFLAGAITAVLIFGLAVGSAFSLMYTAHGRAGADYVFSGPGMGQLGVYLGLSLLACVGYGALFVALSLVFRNPIVPGIVLLGWEAINPVLPSFLQKLSVIFYLRHLAPVDVPARGIFALLTVVTDPVPAWLSVLGVSIVASLVLVFACIRSRRLEISYTSD